jgi:hypothetical protein
MLSILSWNIAHRPELWQELVESEADIALLQEACEPPTTLVSRFDVDRDPWRTEGAGLRRPWRTAVVGLNPRWQMERIPSYSIADARSGDFAVTRPGTLSAAHVTDPDTDQTFTLVSMYAAWERLHGSAASPQEYADASAHRLVSDLSVFVGQEKGHRILVAGDLNILYGHGEHGNPYWAARYRTIFDRLALIGLDFVGPQAPHGRQADPWPEELPRDSLNVPTFHHSRATPATATRQLDFVFASRDIAHRVKVQALNHPEDWGSSDHCRVRVQIV